MAAAGKSFFAAEFDRIHGVISGWLYLWFVVLVVDFNFDILDEVVLQPPEVSAEMPSACGFEEENMKRIRAMNQDELDEARKEIEDKLGIIFL